MPSPGSRSRHVLLIVLFACLAGVFIYRSPPYRQVVTGEVSLDALGDLRNICSNATCALCETPTQKSSQYEPVRGKPTHSFRGKLKYWMLSKSDELLQMVCALRPIILQHGMLQNFSFQATHLDDG
jgi:hypothetical protein